MTHYIWDEWGKGTNAYSRTPKQAPRDKDDHYIENLHRILLDEPKAPEHSWESDYEWSPAAQKGEFSTGY
jgi:hypothetical protein